MTTIDQFREFYQHSEADILEVLDGEGAGTVWTLLPCSPQALRRGIRQLMRSQTTQIRWIRKLNLNSPTCGKIEALGIYRLPNLEQHVYRLDTGEEVKVGLLTDDCLRTVLSEMRG